MKKFSLLPLHLFFQSCHFSKASTKSFSSREMGIKKCALPISGQGISRDLSSQTHNVHVIILHPLMSREEIRDQCRSYSWYLIRRNASSNPTATDGNAFVDLTARYCPCQRHYKIRVVVTNYQLISAEVFHLISSDFKGCRQLHFQLKPTMVSSYAYTHYFSGIHIVSFFYILSVFHFQLRISGMSCPCLSMYCLCSMSLSPTNCLSLAPLTPNCGSRFITSCTR